MFLSQPGKVEITSKERQEGEEDLLANTMITDRRHGLKVMRKGKDGFLDERNQKIRGTLVLLYRNLIVNLDNS